MTPKNLVEKYRALPKQVKASLWFIVCNVLVRGLSFLTLPIFSRLLTTEEYGRINVYQSWLSLVSIITTLTIWGGVFNVGMVKYSDRKYEMISAFQGMATTITLAVGAICLAMMSFLQPVLKMSSLLIVCMFVEIIAQTPFYLWSTEQRYIFEYKKLIAATIAMSLLIPLLGIVAIVNTSHKVEAKILSSIAVQLAFGLYFFVLNQRRGKRYFSREFWKYGFLFNIVLVPHYLSMQVLNQSDRIMINNMCGASDAGIYSVAYSFALLLSLVANGINSSLTPHIYQSLKTGEEKQLKNQTTVVIAVVALFSVALVAFIPDVFHLLLPEPYYPALKVIPPVTAGAFFLFLYPLFGAVEFYYEENKYITAASVIGAALNVVLNYIFIRLYGFIAAAYTTLFCYICFSVFHYSFMRKIMKKRGQFFEIYDGKKLLLISVFVTVFSVLMVCVYDSMLIRWLIIAAVVCVGLWKRKVLVSIFRSLKKS